MSDQTLGRAVLELDADSSKFDSKMDASRGKADGMGKAMGLAIAGGAAVAAAGLVSSISAAANFEHSMDQVGAVVDLTGTSMDEMSKKALQIGKDTAFGATDAAGAMEILAANGISAIDILGGAADAAVSLAAAGGTTLAQAADTVSTSMAVWGLSAAETVEVTNRLAGAANVSRFGVEDMALAIAQGGGAASTAGVEFGDFSTSIAAIAPFFSSGSDAGTSFKQMMISLAKPTPKAMNQMEELGLATDGVAHGFYDAAGALLPMEKIVDNLHNATKDLTEQQKAEALATIFGSDAMRAAAGLSRLTGEEFAKMSQTMANTSAADVAAQRMGNFKGSMEQLKGAIETIQIEIGMKLLPVLTALVSGAAANLPGLFEKASQMASTFWDQLQRAEPIVTPLLAKLGEFTAWFTGNETAMTVAAAVIGTALVIAFGALAVSAGAAAVSVIIATAPIIAITLAAGLLVAGVILLVKHWDEAVAAFPALGEAADRVKEIWVDLKEWINADFMPAFKELAEAVQETGKQAVEFVRKHWDEIKGIIDGVLKILTALLDGWLTAVTSLIEGGLKIITGIINVALGLLTGDWERAWDGIKQIVDGVWTIIKGMLEASWTVIKGLFEGGLQILKNLWSIAWDEMKQKLSDSWDQIKSSTDTAMTEVTGFFSALPGRILGALGDLGSLLWSAGRDLIQGLIDGMTSLPIPNPLDMIPGGGALSTVGGWLKRAAGGPVSSGRSYWVGEHGPELFTPTASGSITKTEDLGGSGAISFNVEHMTVYAQDEQKAKQSVQTVGWALRGVLRAEGHI